MPHIINPAAKFDRNDTSKNFLGKRPQVNACLILTVKNDSKSFKKFSQFLKNLIKMILSYAYIIIFIKFSAKLPHF